MMKRVSVSNAVVFLLIVSACSLTIACGGGLNNPSFPIVSVASTQHPLVANFTIASPCAGTALVQFGPDTSYGRSTASYPVPGGLLQTSILVAGMRASTTYHMRAQVQCAGGSGNSEDLTFRTGPLPKSSSFPALRVSRPPGSNAADEAPGIEMLDTIAAFDPSANVMTSFFTDRDGNPIWYYPLSSGYFAEGLKLTSQGHIVLSLTSFTVQNSLVREVDLAGNTIQELNISSLAQKMQGKGFDFVPIGFHHDLVPLDNGHLIVLVDCIKTISGLTGSSGPTSVQGDALVDLDQNWNPVWAWNGFDHLDVNRHLAGLPDWTHSNAIVYLPNDGNLLLSMRHQSWIIKIDYNNGAGTGDVLWKLGYQGDFALAQGSDPSLWFSYQHFPSLISQNGSQITMSIWDNGDGRVLNSSGELCINPLAGSSAPACYSRAVIFQVDESTMVANLVWAYTPTNGLAGAPGLFSIWGGAINQLSNGNVEFDVNSPALPPDPTVASEVQEVTGTSTPRVIWKMDIPIPAFAYRAYRWPSLYPGVTWQN
jgi:arylsulfate sulfotransferase